MQHMRKTNQQAKKGQVRRQTIWRSFLVPGPGRQYTIAVSAGLALAVAAFVPLWWVQLMTVPALVAVLWLVWQVPVRRSYLVGLVFTAAWLLPTTYWYYAFMSPGVAFAASFGWAALIANMFWLVALRRWIGRLGVSFVFILVWCVVTYARLRLPVVEDWWLPHLGYSMWRNSGIMMIGAWGGEAIIEAALWLSAALVVVIGMKWRRMYAGLVLMVILVGMISMNWWNNHAPSKAIAPVIAVQSMTRGGVDQPAMAGDVDDLFTITDQALANKLRGAMTVVWPENYIPASQMRRLAAYARRHHVNLVYHTTEPAARGGQYKKAVVLNAEGQTILTNYKQHIAPDEIGVARMSKKKIVLNGQSMTAYVCYDLHYPDVVERLAGSEMAFVPLSDAAYGYLQRQFHAADIALHAAQARTTIVAAGTNGPTMLVNSNGVVLRELNDQTKGWIEHE